MPPTPATRRALVTGASGYIGGRLVPALLDEGFTVRVLARSPERLAGKPWIDRVEVAIADANDPYAMAEAMTDVDVAYYLLHSLSTDPSFEQEEERTAQVFANAARAMNVSRIVYLGGLISPEETSETLSPHLRSRKRVGEVLMASGVPTVELRAAVILGSGSASFEMLRYLAERLPVMTTPRWVRVRIQPIAVRDVLRYLVLSADLPAEVNRSFDIGGPEILTYEQMMRRYARSAGLPNPLIIPVPVLSPGLSSHWVGLITPVPASIARPLVESLKHEVVCSDRDIADWIPDPDEGLLSFDDACQAALQKIQNMDVQSRWSNASVPFAPAMPWPGDPDWTGGHLYRDTRQTVVSACPEDVWQVIEGLGGENGWYSWPTVWRARGAIDRAVGGVGLRRGRANPVRLQVGEAVDFWRVEAREENSLLRLRAEMKMPGIGWLEFTLTGAPDGKTHLKQEAIFHPTGLLGHAYWRAITPFHAVVFGSMLRNIAAAAETRSAAPRPADTPME